MKILLDRDGIGSCRSQIIGTSDATGKGETAKADAQQENGPMISTGAAHLRIAMGFPLSKHGRLKNCFVSP